VYSTLSGSPARFEGGLHEVAPGVLAWLAPNGGWGESNAGLVLGEGGALLIDTLWDPVLTRRMLAAMAQRSRVPIRTLVNTHSDGDHVWGNQTVPDAEIVSTRTAARIISETGPAGLARFQGLAPWLRRIGGLPLPVIGRLRVPALPSLGLAELGAYVQAMLAPFDFSQVTVTPPTREFDGQLTLTAGGREVRLIEVGPAHTPGDLIVHIPDAGVVFAADVLFVGVAPLMWAGPTANWIRALDAISALAPEVVVPGHGPVSSEAEVRLLRDYLVWVDAEARARLAAGRSVFDAARSLVLDEAFRAGGWAGWDGHERILVTVATIDRHRRGITRPVSERERAQIFAGMARLARELEDRRGQLTGPRSAS
jgi:cyclase